MMKGKIQSGLHGRARSNWTASVTILMTLRTYVITMVVNLFINMGQKFAINSNSAKMENMQ